MSNHSSEFDDEMNAELKEMIEKIPLGATGYFPEGKLTKKDEGEIRFAVGNKDGKVIIDFGSPVVWVGMKPEQAIELGNLLIKHGLNNV